MRIVLTLALCLLANVAQADALNYDYVYLSKVGNSSNGNGTGGGYKSFGENTHAFFSADDTAFYSGSHRDWNYDMKTWRVGIGGHYKIGKRTMIAPELAVFHSRGTVTSSEWPDGHAMSGNGYMVEVDLRHALTDRIELSAAARRTQYAGDSWNEFIGGVMFHATHHWAFGVLQHRTDQKSATEFTVRYYY